MSRAGRDMSPRDAAADLVRRLHEAGHVAYFVGGCVRDRLLGFEPTEYDIATDAVPEQVRSLFPGARMVGESFGVMLVRSHGHVIEVATFRSDGVSSDHRRPDSVVFTDEHEDVKRRDFTINGLFEDPTGDHVVDHVGGLEDLKAGCLRAIGEPGDRFDEDHLRMLRAVRFAARFEFTIESATAAAIRSHAGSLSGVSSERVGQELRRMFTGGSVVQVVELLASLGLDAAILCDDVAVESWPRCARLDADDAAPASDRFEPALAAWLLDRYGIDAVDGARCDAVGDRLVLSNQERARLASIVHVHARLHDTWEAGSVATRKRLAASDVFDEAVLLRAAMDSDAAAEVRREVESLAGTPSGLAPDPLVSGNDLIEAGLQPGPGFGQLLDQLYDAQLEDRIDSRAQGVDLAKSLVS
jgi:poly(A) polymerase